MGRAKLDIGGGGATIGAMPVEETATALDVSLETVVRDWPFAKAWRQREMSTSPVR